MSRFKIIVIGTSAGGLKALEVILRNLDSSLTTPIVIVQHLSPNIDKSYLKVLNMYAHNPIIIPQNNEIITQGNIYLAPADKHLIIKDNRTFKLSERDRIDHNRPSIDLLFESAAKVYKKQTIGVILTGANSDGTKGFVDIKNAGGLTLVQDPLEAQIPVMPNSAIESNTVDMILPLKDISKMLNKVLKE